MLFSIGLLTTGLSQDTPLLIPFSTTDDVDLKRSFSERIQSATIVGLGESTHYTKECYDLKFTLIQQLIEEGFNALVLEVDFGQALLWNRYVTYNEGNLDSLIASSGWFTYRTEEFKRLLKSIHDYNLTAEEPFQLAGMEMTAIKHNLTWMQSFLDELGLKSAVLDSILHHEVPSIAFYNHSSADRKAYWSLFLELEDLLPKRTVASAKLSSLGVAYRMLEIFRQYATYVSQDDFSLVSPLTKGRLALSDQMGLRILLFQSAIRLSGPTHSLPQNVLFFWSMCAQTSIKRVVYVPIYETSTPFELMQGSLSTQMYQPPCRWYSEILMTRSSTSTLHTLLLPFHGKIRSCCFFIVILQCIN